MRKWEKRTRATDIYRRIKPPPVSPFHPLFFFFFTTHTQWNATERNSLVLQLFVPPVECDSWYHLIRHPKIQKTEETRNSAGNTKKKKKKAHWKEWRKSFDILLNRSFSCPDIYLFTYSICVCCVWVCVWVLNANRAALLPNRKENDEGRG